MANDIRIGIIGGSGLYQMAGLTDNRRSRNRDPFWKAIGLISVGTLEGKRVAFLARHNRNTDSAVGTELPRQYLRV